ncbi:hypothetical protein PVL29_019526 [Vitis rotundifolia]|uniref:RING-type E3 ubiquitin transferase n=1 Tax=Vitis rotundifolia TaxID=103349 RepID=A0AA38Z0Q3_VITRO|nr:hypothetical protein PVL29_019526 [Vitis rotundifolia]
MTVTGMECAVCLEEIEGDELARMVPACSHGFHLECAGTWLSKHSACPLCRAPITALRTSSSGNIGMGSPNNITASSEWPF